MVCVSKILLSCRDVYVFSIKKSPDHPEKDGKLEMFGGNVEADETPFEGLVRELEEEEETGTLAGKVKNTQPALYKQFPVDGKMQCIFQMEVSEYVFNLLRAHPDESYGIRTVKKKLFATPDQLNLEQFTPKTQEIFKQLGMIQ